VTALPDQDSGATNGRVGHRVLAIVVTYNSRPHLEALARSMPPAMEGIGSWRLAVIDSGSTDGTADSSRGLWPAAMVMELGTNRGYAAGINAGLAVAQPDEDVLVLNPDIRLRRGSVAELARALERPGVGITVPRLVGPDGRLQHSLRHEPALGRTLAETLLGARVAARLGVGETIATPARYRTEGPVDWATGAVLLVGAACARAIGDWDETFFLYSEETDYALRAREAGLRTWYVPAAEALHVGGEATTSAPLWSLLSVNRVRLYRRRHGRLRGQLFWAAMTAGALLRAVLPAPRHRAALRELVLRGRP
jgi:N-acetylglucosaminyl-diphospho-decaprenol L-rhamnosyltransferase